jgi:Zn-dependent protease with chaperone function
MADPAAGKLPLRHPAENPTFILMVILNFAILGVLIDFLSTVALIPPALRGTNWEATIRAVAAAIILVAPAIMIVRQVQRASIRGMAVQLSRTQFPDLYASTDEFAAALGVKPAPTVYLSNGNGTLNAFAAQSGWTNNYVVLSNELFANLRNNNREGTRFILGHEIGHIRLHHVALWYQLVLCYSQLIPILGPTLSRLREYSCDRNGAALEPKGELGLILLTAGRYAADNVRAGELVSQGRHLGGFWVGISQLPRSHPWTVRRIWRLHQLGLFGGAGTVDRAHRPQEVVLTAPGEVTRARRERARSLRIA